MLQSKIISVVKGKSMKVNSKIMGDSGEKFAANFLIDSGYKILARNFRVHATAEIDIIAQIDDTIVFVEVKTRSTNRFGTPAESVTIKKQKKIFTAAEIFLQQNNLNDKSCRFDVVEVFAMRNGFSANHIIDAFAL